MRIALALSTSIIALFIASASHAECETTVYAEVDSAYAFPDLGIAVTEGPVLQAGATRTCGKLSLDVWTSTDLTAKGPYGNRGGGDEIDITLTRNDTVESVVGTLEIETSAAYWILADFKRAKDDVVGIYVQVGRPVSLGKTTVTPYARLTEWVGVGNYPDTTLVRYGAKASLPLSERWNLDIDASHVSENVDHLSTWGGELALTRSFEKGWSMTGTIKAAERMPTVFAFGFARSF